MTPPMTDTLKVYDLLREAQMPELQARAITRAIRESDTVAALDVRAVIDERFKLIDERFNRIDERFNRIDERFDRIDEKFATKAELAETKSELVRWMFGFWVGQLAVIIALIKLWH
jgi:hypothetical protein